IIISFLCLGPGWAVASATALAAMFLNRMPGKEDQPFVQIAGGILFLCVIVILMFGGKIEALLERINKYVVGFIFASLIILCVGFVPGSAWADIFTGFFKFGWLPAGKIDWFLLAGLAGYAGAGGIFNTAQSNWFRDKGYAMGGTVGYIPSLIGGRQIRVSPVGKVFRLTEENVNRFRTWWRYAVFDQTWVWGLGCWIGMFLCTLLAYGMIPTGTKLTGWAAAAHQAEGVAKVLGPVGWYWVLFIGFWVLWGTQLTVSDTFVRQVTDLLWYASPTIRQRWCKEDIRKLYYAILIAFTIWAFYMFNQGVPLHLVALVANFANVAFFVGAIQLLFIDRMLPARIRGSWLTKLGVAILMLFYGAFMVVGLGSQLFGLKF
ncbi:MAG TPA: Nramp family divalent metal transporter, partial [Firmicutes bacterium]|nr:Nramp family divalent metal transporter [Bacillota bacterium]